MTSKDNEPMETTRKDEENQLYHDDDGHKNTFKNVFVLQVPKNKAKK